MNLEDEEIQSLHPDFSSLQFDGCHSRSEAEGSCLCQIDPQKLPVFAAFTKSKKKQQHGVAAARLV